MLEGEKSSLASDVYSLGIVLWEVVSRQLPWANVFGVRPVHVRVVVNRHRPEIPSDTPADIAQIMRDCWDDDPRRRPTATEIFARIRREDGRKD